MSKIEDDICALIQSRAAKGLEKYGVTLERDDLTLRQWLDHAIEESLDRVLYLYRARMKLVEDERGEAPADERIDWAAHRWATHAAADEDGSVYLFHGRPELGTYGKWLRPYLDTKMERINATIPGPWQDSLRKRPAAELPEGWVDSRAKP